MLKTKLMGHPEFENEEKKSPVWILQAIQSTLYQFDDTKPLSLALDDAMKAMMCFCQLEHMDKAIFLKNTNSPNQSIWAVSWTIWLLHKYCKPHREGGG